MLNLTPYIILNGQSREALDFYQSVFGGEVEITTFAQFNPDPGKANLVMHGELRAPTLRLMLSDNPEGGTRGGGNITLCLWGEDEEAAHKLFDALSEGGRVNHPLTRESWGDIYGDLVDQFGVSWSVDAGKPVI